MLVDSKVVKVDDANISMMNIFVVDVQLQKESNKKVVMHGWGSESESTNFAFTTQWLRRSWGCFHQTHGFWALNMKGLEHLKVAVIAWNNKFGI